MKIYSFALILFIFVNGIYSTKILYTNTHNLCLLNFNSNGDNVTAQVLIGNLKDVSSLDYLDNEKTIFWLDHVNEVIRRYHKHNSSKGEVKDVVLYPEVAPEQVAVDWVGLKLYWIGNERSTIEVSQLDGTQRKVLLWEDVAEARGLALHPTKRLMFWTDCGHLPKIGRAGMDGSEVTVIMERDTCSFWPNGISVDQENDRLYFTEDVNNKIISCSIDGSDVRELSPREMAFPALVTISEDQIFWTNWKNYSIHFCQKKNCTDSKLLTSTHKDIKDAKVVHPPKMLQAANPCGSNNGGCSHLCLLSPSSRGYSCACPAGIRLLEDTFNCAPGLSKVLLVVRWTDLRWISLDVPDYTVFVIPLGEVRHAVVVDYDPVRGHLYWSDFSLQSIKRAYLNGSGIETVIQMPYVKPEGVAVDWLGRNLFWIDTENDRVQVTQLDGLYHKTIVDTELEEPRAIAVDPLKGRIYWTDWGNKSKIETSFMDGSGREALATTDLKWPNGLALDAPMNRLYWGDAKLDRIEYMDLDTRRRTVLLEGTSHVYGLTIMDEYIYWSDLMKRLVQRVHKETGQNRTTIVEEMPDLMGLKAYSTEAPRGENSCSRSNGGCSHFCLMRSADHACACPDDLELLPDNKTCLDPSTFLIYATSSKIQRVSVVTGRDVALVTGIGSKDIRAVKGDVRSGKVFWADAATKAIYSIKLDGTELSEIIKNVICADIAINGALRHLYWSNLLDRRIEIMDLERKFRKVIVWEGVAPLKLALDPSNGYLFWINSLGDKFSIERSKLDGSSRREVISKTRHVITEVVTDAQDRRLFWIRDGVLSSSTYDGTDHAPLRAGVRNFGTLEDGSLFFLLHKEKKIFQVEKRRLENASRVFDVEVDVVDVDAFDTSVMPRVQPSRCNLENGDCSHLCIGLNTNASCACKNPGNHLDAGVTVNTGGKQELCSCPQSRVCLCPNHFSLDESGRTCEAPKNFLLLGQNGSIVRLLAEKSQENFAEVILNSGALKKIRSIRHDRKRRKIFWIENKTKSIKTANENGTQMELVYVNASLNFLDMALNENSRLIYFTEHHCSCIMAVRTDGTILGKVVDKVQSKHVAVAPRAGYLFWTVHGRTHKLERSQLDGSSRITLVNTGLGKLGQIEVDDYKSQRSTKSSDRGGRIFWIDTELRLIESADFDGGNRGVIVRDTAATGLTLIGPWLLWVTRDSVVERVDRADPKMRTRLWTGLNSITSITAARESNAPDGKFGMGVDDGLCPADACSHFCVAEDESVTLAGTSVLWRCSCPLGMQLTDSNKTCRDPLPCSEKEFACRSDGHCVPINWRCDQHPDCIDKSDEMDCRNRSTTRRPTTPEPCNKDGLVACLRGDTCIQSSQRCDGTLDCSDGSDESDCSSNTTYAVGLGVASAVIVLVTGAVLLGCLCRQKSQKLPTAYPDDIVMVAGPSPSLPDSNTMLLGSGDLSSCSQIDGERSLRMVGGRTGHSSSKSFYADLDDESVFYDRGHITGASSTSGSAITDRPAFDPPPSPITDRSVACASPLLLPTTRRDRSQQQQHYRYRSSKINNSCASSGNYNGYHSSSSHRHKKRHKRHRVRHLPTPCSSTSGEVVACEDFLFAPPPPTPQSSLSLSSQGTKTPSISYPPSPSTGRSLYPPPPPSSLRRLSEEDDDDSCSRTCSNATERKIQIGRK